MEQGQTLYLSLFIPIIYYEKGFMPSLIIMGSDITSQGTVPSFIEVPKGANFIVVEGQRPEYPIYEPFGPSSYYRLAEVRLIAPTTGTYYIAVYEPNQGGHFGLAIGYREEFTLTERVLIPINMIKVHQWEGQSLGFILAPMIGTLIIGFALLMVYRFRRVVSPQTAFGWTAALAGLFFLGSGAIHLTQMIVALINTHLSYEAVITILLFLPSIIFTIIAFRIALKDSQRVGIKKRIVMFIIGFLSLGMILFNSGLLVGSFLAMIASILPTQRK